MDDRDGENCLIRKNILHRGTECVNFVNGTRVKFHYQTKTCPENGEQKVLDDSKKISRPMELVIGKKFKLEVWEVIVQKMALCEVAKFHVDKSLVTQYPFIAKTLRDAFRPPEERKHCCGMTLQNEGIGYKDLDELFANPCDLEFIIEIISIEQPDQYEKDSWQLNDDEKLKTVNRLREEGNELYRQKKHLEAEAKYQLALGMIEQLILKEKPQDDDWWALIHLKVPLLLNYSQCKLLAKDYYVVIEHCNEVIQHEPNNVKALYRRAKAHIGAWNPDDARKDLIKCMELDKSLTPKVQKDLAELNDQIKLNELNDKLKYQNMFGQS